jgi:hypothetical protein
MNAPMRKVGGWQVHPLTVTGDGNSIGIVDIADILGPQVT